MLGTVCVMSAAAAISCDVEDEEDEADFVAVEFAGTVIYQGNSKGSSVKAKQTSDAQE